jgi:hypothetical protein
MDLESWHVWSSVRSVPWLSLSGGHKLATSSLILLLSIYTISMPVLTGTATRVEEGLRFRHVVRNVYAFEFEPDRPEHLAD